MTADNRIYCDDCFTEYAARDNRRLAAAGPAALAKLRAEGRDPRVTTSAQEQRRATRLEIWRLDKEWDETHLEHPSRESFVAEVLPGLARVALADMVAATELSKGQCSFIRRGLFVPHARHWGALRRLVDNRGFHAR